MAIEKGKVELLAGAIVPLERGLWHAAWEKLQEAATGIEQMENANNRIEYENGWTRMVDSLEEFWARFFDEGRGTFSSFQPWAGAIDAKRKGDELLAYLYQARHQSQHGRLSLEWGDGEIETGGGEFFGTIRNFKLFSDGTFEADVNKAPGSGASLRTIHEPGKARLPPIENKKHKQLFRPPAEHLGNLIEMPSPINVGRLGVLFYEDVLRKGYEKFGKAP